MFQLCSGSRCQPLDATCCPLHPKNANPRGCAESLDDVYVLNAPKRVQWPATALRWSSVYDVDDVVLDHQQEVHVDYNLELCADFFPCALRATGSASVLDMSADASLACDGKRGCRHLTLKSINLVGGERMRAALPPLQVQASVLTVESGIMSSFSSQGDGGAIRCDDQGSVVVRAMRFENTHSLQRGGAIVSRGGCSTLVSECLFRSCSALAHGGAIEAAGELNISATSFQGQPTPPRLTNPHNYPKYQTQARVSNRRYPNYQSAQPAVIPSTSTNRLHLIGWCPPQTFLVCRLPGGSGWGLDFGLRGCSAPHHRQCL